MIASDYLRVKRKLYADDPMSNEYVLDIPNLEIKSFFEIKFIDKFLKGRDMFGAGLENLIRGNIRAFEDDMQYIFLTSTSHFDFKQEEANYHLFILGMLVALKKTYKEGNMWGFLSWGLTIFIILFIAILIIGAIGSLFYGAFLLLQKIVAMFPNLIKIILILILLAFIAFLLKIILNIILTIKIW